MNPELELELDWLELDDPEPDADPEFCIGILKNWLAASLMSLSNSLAPLNLISIMTIILSLPPFSSTAVMLTGYCPSILFLPL